MKKNELSKIEQENLPLNREKKRKVVFFFHIK